MGRPKGSKNKIKQLSEESKQIIANIEPVVPEFFDAEKLGKIDDEYVKQAERQHYNPFKNPRFKNKMGLKD